MFSGSPTFQETGSGFKYLSNVFIFSDENHSKHIAVDEEHYLFKHKFSSSLKTPRIGPESGIDRKFGFSSASYS